MADVTIDTHAPARVVRFGPFEADVRTGELRKDGRRVRISNQSFAVLALLVARPGELVTREELCASLWPAGTFVEYEQGLNAAINRVREALGDSAASPRFIETLPKRGYRFIAPVTVAAREVGPATSAPAEDAPERDATPPPAVPRRHTRGLVIGSAVLVAALATWMALTRYVHAPGVDDARSDRGWTVTPFTSFLGEERMPSFSPDGSQIVFARREAGDAAEGFDLYVKTVGSERLLRLTSRPSRWISPAWSPDGSRIAFARTAGDDSGLFLISALGGPEHRIADASSSSPTFMRPSWSSDGRLLAYSSVSPTGSSIVRLLTLDTLSSRPLPSAPPCWDAGAPAFSPDGQRLAFLCTSSVAVYDVDLYTMGSGAPTTVASMMGTPRGLAWASDGRSLIVANDAGDGGGLWRLSLDGTRTRLPFGELASEPAVARTGGIAYVRGTSQVHVWRMALSSARTPQALIASTRADMTPQFSPDGRHIVFQSNRSGTPEIWLADASGASLQQLTSSNGAMTGAPTWCGDGRRIAFDSRVSGTSAIYVMTVGEGRSSLVATTQLNLALPAWSTDCRWLIASDGRSTLFRFPAAGGPATRFTTHSAYYAQVVGDRAIFNVRTPPGVMLWTKSVDGGDERPLARMPPLAYDDPWAVAPSGIYFVRTAVGPTTVERYDFTTGATVTVGRLPRVPTPLGGLGLAVSRDERWLLFTQTDETEADVMLATPQR
jgi:Tol biopolymer transport system component/DNA-binding winged helix-turn-helix (wHTH) protein